MGFATNYAFLMCGHFVAGIGVGYALMIAPVYTAEISSASARGFLTTFPEIFISHCVLSGFISIFAFSGLAEHISWRMMFLVGVIPPILIFAGVLIVMSESPRWLVMQGRLEEATAVLAKTSDSPEVSISGAFLLDAGIAVIGFFFFFFYFFLLETKGRILEEMEKLFRKKEKHEGKVDA